MCTNEEHFENEQMIFLRGLRGSGISLMQLQLKLMFTLDKAGFHLAHITISSHLQNTKSADAVYYNIYISHRIHSWPSNRGNVNTLVVYLFIYICILKCLTWKIWTLPVWLWELQETWCDNSIIFLPRHWWYRGSVLLCDTSLCHNVWGLCVDISDAWYHDTLTTEVVF